MFDVFFESRNVRLFAGAALISIRRQESFIQDLSWSPPDLHV